MSKSVRTIVRISVLSLTIIIFVLTFKTLGIGLHLVSISEQNSNSNNWRINGSGIVAANGTYEDNQKERNALYTSQDFYERFISTANNIVRIPIAVALILLFGLSLYIWYVYFQSRFKRIKRFLKKHKRLGN